MSKDTIKLSRHDVKSVLDETRSQPTDEKRLNVGETYFDRYENRSFDDSNLLELFHENTKNSGEYSKFALASVSKFTEDERYMFLESRTSDYAEAPTVDLPEPGTLEESVGTVVERRRSRREMTGENVSLRELSTLLHYGCGVTGGSELGIELPSGAEPSLSFRTYPSAGGLYPVEPYVLVVNHDELAAGIYYYKPEAHALRVVQEDPAIEDRIADVYRNLDVVDPRDSAVTVVLTAEFWRSMAKYGPRAYRLILQESGHLAQNLLVAAEAQGLASVPTASFTDRKLNDYLGVDGVDEACLYSISVGKRGETDG